MWIFSSFEDEMNENENRMWIFFFLVLKMRWTKMKTACEFLSSFEDEGNKNDDYQKWKPNEYFSII